MKKRFSITALLGLVTAAAGVIMAVLAVAGYRSGELHFMTAIQNFERGVYTSAAAFILSLAALWLTRTGNARRGLWPSLLGLALSLPLTVYIANFEYAARAYPPINDISTDTDDPPAFWEVPNPVMYPGAQVADLQRDGYPEIGPLELDTNPERAFELALAIARDMDWEIVSENAADMQIEAVASSFLFGFKDNVAIRLQPINGRTRVDMRSHSRLGRIDRGANAKRILAYLHALRQRAAADRDS
jgi:uncharacterized protein (DUF1499 family)